MTKRELIIGVDLRDDYSGLSYALNLLDEPESISIKNQEHQFLIPTVIGLQNEKKRWVYGKEALDLEKKHEAQVVINLVDKIKKADKIKLYDRDYDPIYLMERFISKLLTESKVRWPSKTIRQMVVTIEKPDENLVNGLYKALENLGIFRDRVQVVGHSNSYLGYVLCQEKGIWAKDVALFDFSEDDFIYSQISIERQNMPYVTEVYKKSYSDSITYSQLEDLKETNKLDYILENIINDALYKEVISTIYFTGKGFIDGISTNLVKKISKGRRIFIGQNLYCKGACYLAGQLAGGTRLDDFIFLLNDTSHYSVSIQVDNNDSDKEVVLGQIGRSIYEEEKTLEIILDKENKVPYIVKDKRGHIIFDDEIALEDLPKRPNKTTRIRISLDFISNLKFKLQIKDMGFGDLYPGTGMVWEKEVVLNG